MRSTSKERFNFHSLGKIFSLTGEKFFSFGRKKHRLKTGSIKSVFFRKESENKCKYLRKKA